MLIFPAIDLYGGRAVRLYKGDYAQMTVYSDHPLEVARDFARAGATWLHTVDLEGARDGTTPNLEIVRTLARESGLRVEVGGGIRSPETVRTYLESGVARVILGTAAVTDEVFLRQMLAEYGDRIAVGVDIKDGMVAIHGWTQTSDRDARAFCRHMQELGVRTVICTDISKDGAMRGTNRALYGALSRELEIDIIASGGVSSMDDVRHLTSLGLYGAIIGKAYYTGDIDLAEAVKEASV